MSESKATRAARLKRLEKQLAAAEVLVVSLRGKIAKLDVAPLAPDPEFDIAPLWEVTPATARKRTSRHACRVAWKSIPKNQRPIMDEAVAAMKAWSRDPEWKKDGGQFIPSLEKWIKQRRWEDAPETETADSRYRNAPKALPKNTEAAATPEEMADIFAALKPRRMNS